MGTIRKLIHSLTFLYPIIFVASVGATGLIHKSTIQGLAAYKHLSPIVSLNGTYHGFVATDEVNDRIDVYDASGILWNTIETVNNARMAIGRLSSNSDTLIIYALEDTVYAWTTWYNYNLLRITVIRMVDEYVSSETHVPECFLGYGNLEPGISALLEFDLDDQYEPVALTFQATLSITAQESTMGTRTSNVSTHIEYSLDLSEIAVRTPSSEYVTGYFGGFDTCGYAEFRNLYTSVNDDPWNSYTSSSTRTCVVNCANTLATLNSEGSYSSRLFVGDFVPGTGSDEIIYVGYAHDLLGLREGRQSHWVCYSVENNTLTEEWWILPPWKFQPHSYLNHINAIIGIVNGLSAHLLDCESGTYIDSFPLNHVMNDKSFLVVPGKTVPNIFGRLGDTVFVYDLEAPTGVVPSEESVMPDDFVLLQNYPNPFNPMTTIEYSIPTRSHVTIEIFNVLGQKVRTLVDEIKSAGSYQIEWSGDDHSGRSVSTGVYLYRLKADDFVQMKKMLLLE
jgi:hypothetical protein